MKRRAQAFVMAFIMFFMTVAVPLLDTVAVKAENSPSVDNSQELKVMFHYLREDGNYDGWDVFTWGTPNSNNAFQTNESGYVTDENGAVAEVTVTPGTQEFGYIIRKGGDSWEAKDWDGDRFVNVD
ncbi:MAG: hypothetical protein IKJ01_01630, partial [Lachnospiraceae bacterium]|nr:hypothetical protein [Lachnospiraceae bacterium]